MRPQREISHKGRIVSVSGDRISVEIVSESACAACRVSGLCGVADSKKKIVEIRVVGKTGWKVGQEVIVCLGQSMGLKAVFYSYVIPLLILLILILSLSTIGLSDWATGLIAVGGVACYYLAIYFFRDRFAGNYEFYIRDI
ncbi:MAG: SoxR reducing system RseC family protein [Bacteroidales bacterium]|jgi:sigma-E factor negative regulatory protein RseC|nr:SoxR reducing system RseC family protein [Bacteroidota bacterium]NLN98672.1 SoxR reducing system RseC family protein [Bacteroidales bacterium]